MTKISKQYESFLLVGSSETAINPSPFNGKGKALLELIIYLVINAKKLSYEIEIHSLSQLTITQK